MNLTPKQKIDLMRQAEISPGAAFLNAIAIMSTQMDELMNAKITKIESMFVEKLSSIEAGLADKVVLKHIQKLKGDPGADAIAPTADEVGATIFDDLVIAVAKKIPTPKNGEKPTKEELMALIEPLIPKVENGKTPTKDELASLIMELYPQFDKEDLTEADVVRIIKDNLPDQKPITAEELFSILERAHPSLTIDASRIRNLPRQKGTQGKYHPAHGGGSTSAPTSSTTTVDGLTTTFAVGSRPTKVYADNLTLFENVTAGDGGQYTYSAGFITIFFPPQNYVKYE